MLFMLTINIVLSPPHVSCFSSVGNRHVGKQRLSIGTNCDRIATIEHEFLHALGFWHEQSRSDRDDYVKIMWDRITEGTEPLTASRSQTLIIDLHTAQACMHSSKRKICKCIMPRFLWFITHAKEMMVLEAKGDS